MEQGNNGTRDQKNGNKGTGEHGNRGTRGKTNL